MLQLGLFYAADKQPEKAVETLGEVLAKDAKNWMAYRGRGDALSGHRQAGPSAGRTTKPRSSCSPRTPAS